MTTKDRLNLTIEEFTQNVIKQLKGLAPAGSKVRFEITAYYQPHETIIDTRQSTGVIIYACPDIERLAESKHSALPRIIYEITMPDY